MYEGGNYVRLLRVTVAIDGFSQDFYAAQAAVIITSSSGIMIYNYSYLCKMLYPKYFMPCPKYLCTIFSFFLETNMKAIKAPRLRLRLKLNIIIQRKKCEVEFVREMFRLLCSNFFGFVRYNNDRKVWNWSKWHLKIDMILIRTFFFFTMN